MRIALLNMALLMLSLAFVSQASAQNKQALLGANIVQDQREWWVPKGLVWKNIKWSLTGKDDSPTVVFGPDGRLTAAGYYYYKLGTDPAWFEQHLKYALTNDSWKPDESPTFKGTSTSNQSIIHRMCGCLKSFQGTVNSSKAVDPAFKKALFTPQWREGCEKVFRDFVNDRGMLGFGGNEYPMAQTFHLLRSSLQDGRQKGNFIREEQVWTLDKAQALVRALLTDPDMASPEDVWHPASEAFLAKLKEKGAADANERAEATADAPTTMPTEGEALNARRVKDGKVFYQGGLFIGWGGSQPSLHATWDGLAIINILYSHYPQPDPTKPDSIFYLWDKQPPEKRERGVKLIKTLADRLWLDYRDRGGPTYCHVVGRKPSENLAAPSEASILWEHSGYSPKDMAHWANLCWNEMFGEPKGPPCDGVQALLAIANGGIWNPADRDKVLNPLRSDAAAESQKK